jgi:RTX calcium-binding nonapeptide repeat (4 copies)
VRRTLLLTFLLLSAPATAHAATASIEGGALRLIAAPGEYNALSVAPAGAGLSVTDSAYPVAAGPGCTAQGTGLMCVAAARVEADLGDGDDSLALSAALPADLRGGLGNDSLSVVGVAATSLDGGDGDDTLTAGGGADVLTGGLGDDALVAAGGADLLSGGDGFDVLAGGDGDDRLDGGTGDDSAAGGNGADSIVLRDSLTDTATCGAGRDSVRAEVLDQLDFACERVDYGPAGRIGRLRPIIGGGRFVPIPGQSWALVDRRILANVLYLIRRYHVRVGDGYAIYGHAPRGEHPLGLAVDLYPGPGGSWRELGRLAKWAEPRQNRPRPPFRWVGWNGDDNHGDPRHCRPVRGCPPHLHLSWAHSPGKPRRPVRKVWVFDVQAPPG